MGLDIHLYRYENFAASIKKEKSYSEASGKHWEFAGIEYNELTEEQKNEAREKDKQFATSLGLDEIGVDREGKVQIELDSKLYPEHYFKIGYFRSSYNDSGINRILDNLGLPDLYELFEKDDDGYEFQPDWKLSLTRVNKTIEQLKNAPAYRCFSVGWNEFEGHPNGAKITNESEAMQAFLEEAKRSIFQKEGGYSNKTGHFYPRGLKIVGLISGAQKRFFVKEKLPCTFVIYEDDNEWYVQALEIVKETIEYVLNSGEAEKYYLHWSD